MGISRKAVYWICFLAPRPWHLVSLATGRHTDGREEQSILQELRLLLGRYHSWHCHEPGLPGHTPKGSGKSVVASFPFPDESVLLPNSGCHLAADTISMERLLPARLIRQIRFVFIACLSCQQRCWGWLEGCELAALLLEMVPLLPQAFRLNLERCA